MATAGPTLHPSPVLRGGPTLALRDGWLVVTKPNGRSERFRPGGRAAAGGAAVAVLAHGRTTVRPPTSDGGQPLGVPRSSWRLLDGDGQPLVWLANADAPLYDLAQAREFAAATGLEFRDVGTVLARELTATRPVSSMNGPGTGRLSATLAPGRQWGWGVAALAGTLFTVPVVPPFWSDGQLSGIGGVVVLVALLVLVIGSVGAAGRLGGGLAALTWRRYWRGRPSDPRLLLTARRLPGVALGVAAGGELEVRDLGRARSIVRGDGLALQPYEIPPGRSRPANGLLVRASQDLVAHIPARFDPEEVHAFAGELGARSLPPTNRADVVPERRKKTRQGRRADRPEAVVGRRSLYAWGVAAWALTALTPALAAGAALIAAGRVEVSLAYAASCVGAGCLAISAWVLHVTQTPVWLRRPVWLDPENRG